MHRAPLSPPTVIILGLFTHVWDVRMLYLTDLLALSVSYCSSLCLYHLRCALPTELSQNERAPPSPMALPASNLAQDKPDHYMFPLY